MLLPSDKPSAAIQQDMNLLTYKEEDLRHRVSRIRYDLTTGELLPRPPLGSDKDFLPWIEKLETDLKDAGIPEVQWSDAAILFIEDSQINIEMRQARERRSEKGEGNWPWEDFKEYLYRFLVERDSRSSIQKLREDHPTLLKAAGAGLVIAGGSVLGPALVVTGLNGVGFTSTGVAAGSWATGIQSVVYGGATSGLFSICQSIGATAVPASAGTVVSAIGTVAAGVGLIKKGPKPHDSPDQPENRDGKEVSSSHQNLTELPPG